MYSSSKIVFSSSKCPINTSLQAVPSERRTTYLVCTCVNNFKVTTVCMHYSTCRVCWSRTYKVHVQYCTCTHVYTCTYKSQRNITKIIKCVSFLCFKSTSISISICIPTTTCVYPIILDLVLDLELLFDPSHPFRRRRPRSTCMYVV